MWISTWVLERLVSSGPYVRTCNCSFHVCGDWHLRYWQHNIHHFKEVKFKEDGECAIAKGTGDWSLLLSQILLFAWPQVVLTFDWCDVIGYMWCNILLWWAFRNNFLLFHVLFGPALTIGPNPYYWPNTKNLSYGSSPPLATRSGWIAVALLPFVMWENLSFNFLTLDENWYRFVGCCLRSSITSRIWLEFLMRNLWCSAAGRVGRCLCWL